MEPVAPSPIALNMKVTPSMPVMISHITLLIAESRSGINRQAGPKLFKTPRALSSEEIEEIIERFANTAALAQKAGFDGVQIHMAHGYLLRFLSQISRSLARSINQSLDCWA